MSERRPHWDDELIFAVMSAAGDGGHLFIDDIHAVIAAVEDWQDRHTDSPNCGVCDEQWPCAASAEAAIARVREKPYLNARPHGQPEPWREGYNQALREVLRALDGDA
jgi:hypothetical protein